MITDMKNAIEVVDKMNNVISAVNDIVSGVTKDIAPIEEEVLLLKERVDNLALEVNKVEESVIKPYFYGARPTITLNNTQTMTWNVIENMGFDSDGVNVTFKEDGVYLVDFGLTYGRTTTAGLKQTELRIDGVSYSRLLITSNERTEHLDSFVRRFKKGQTVCVESILSNITPTVYGDLIITKLS